MFLANNFHRIWFVFYFCTRTRTVYLFNLLTDLSSCSRFPFPVPAKRTRPISKLQVLFTVLMHGAWPRPPPTGSSRHLKSSRISCCSCALSMRSLKTADAACCLSIMLGAALYCHLSGQQTAEEQTDSAVAAAHWACAEVPRLLSPKEQQTAEKENQLLPLRIEHAQWSRVYCHRWSSRQLRRRISCCSCALRMRSAEFTVTEGATDSWGA